MKIIYFFIIVGFFISCGSTKKMSDTNPNSDNMVVYNENDSGKNVELNQNVFFEISLPANKTTGFKWDVIKIDSTILQKVSDNYIESNAQSKLIGVGGIYIVKFKTIAKGKTALKLIYHRPFENSGGKRNFNLSITIK